MNQRIDPSPLLEPVISVAIEAGGKIMEIYATDFDVQHKEDSTPLTEADLVAHQVIVAGLAALTPNIPVLSEESEASPYKERIKWGQYWLVDPLDGTREFVKRNDEFSVNIALIQDHESVLGVIYAPVQEVCYYACRNKGAFKRSGNRISVPIHTNTTREERSIVVVGSRSRNGEQQRRFLEKLGQHTFMQLGSSLKSCIIAEGKADVYPRFGPTSEWDTAAAQCIVEEAGGCITNMQLEPLRYNTKKSLINPYFLVFGDPRKNWAEILA